MCCTILASLIGKQCVLFSANIKQKGKLRNIGQHSSWWLMIAEEISPQKFDCPLSNTPPLSYCSYGRQAFCSHTVHIQFTVIRVADLPSKFLVIFGKMGPWFQTEEDKSRLLISRWLHWNTAEMTTVADFISCQACHAWLRLLSYDWGVAVRGGWVN